MQVASCNLKVAVSFAGWEGKASRWRHLQSQPSHLTSTNSRRAIDQVEKRSPTWSPSIMLNAPSGNAKSGKYDHQPKEIGKNSSICASQCPISQFNLLQFLMSSSSSSLSLRSVCRERINLCKLVSLMRVRRYW